LKYIFNKL